MPRRIPRFCLRARVSKGLVTYVMSPVPDSFPPCTRLYRPPSFFSYPHSHHLRVVARPTRYQTDISLASTDDPEAGAEAGIRGNDGYELGSGSDPRSRPGFWRKSLTNIHQLLSGR